MKRVLILSVLLTTLAGCTSGYNDFNNPSPQNVQAQVSGYNDYRLCNVYFNKMMGGTFDDDFRYKYSKPIVAEVEKRNLDCNSFPELADKEAWREDWIKEYEESLELWKGY